MQAELISKMADAVSQRFNINMETYFPKFSKELRELNRWREQIEEEK